MERITDKIYGRPKESESHIAIGTIGHLGRVPLVAGLSSVGNAVFQQWLIHSITLFVFFQHLQPHEVILMAVVVVHRKLLGNLRFHQY